MNKKLLALLLAFVMVFSLAACGEQPKTSDTTSSQQQDSTSPTETSSNAGNDTTPSVIVRDNKEEGFCTYNDVWASQPNNWNPHAWEMSHESVFMDYTVAPFTYGTFDGEGGWYYAYDAATSVTDVTATYADKE
ncbi:MAG: hypothetical protein Q4A41_03800, partial [Bacillota bacterium]|nr:hypothetical protein [Bacillota bacterium]